MRNTKSFIVFILILAVVAIAGFVMVRNQLLVSQPELQQKPATKVGSSGQTTNRNPATPSSRPLYGKTSLSEEEKRILCKPFEDLYVNVKTDRGAGKFIDERKTVPKAYKVGMICLKHRLTRTEVMELISTPPAETSIVSTNLMDVDYQIGGCKRLIFKFDEKGNIKSVEGDGVHSLYEFPPLEAVTSDTSIEPPEPLPRSAIYRIIDEKVRADILKQSTPP